MFTIYIVSHKERGNHQRIARRRIISLSVFHFHVNGFKSCLTDRAGADNFYSQGRAQDHGETAADMVGWEMVLSLYVGGHTRGRVYRDPRIHHKEAEHGRAVHCNTTNSGPL